MKNRIKKVLIFIVLFISSILIVGTIYYKNNFPNQDFETILYNIKYGVEKSNPEVIWIGFKQSIIKLIICFTIFIMPVIKKIKNKYYINVKFKNHKKEIKVFPFKNCIYCIVIFVLSMFFTLKGIGLFEYIKMQRKVSSVFENEYVNTAATKIEFPSQKRNLIFIFLESMENSMFLEEDGGEWEYALIPELENLTKENINFSNTNTLGGGREVAGACWTVAGMVGQTCGIPLKVEINDNDYSGYSSFLPGAYSLGDILESEGYNQEVMFGSDASFGARDTYFTTHGNYEIFDVNTAIEEDKMTEEDKVWWGFSDDDLFKWSKEEILDLADEEQPFCYILLTADTHFVDGYLSEKADILYEKKYENVYAYSSKCVNEFVEWIQQQKFYDNTTIVLVGDHLGMEYDFYQEHIDNENYIRTVYNVFIISAIPVSNNKNRQFATLDIFPTVLASMGVKIEGDRLGLGTNLFSGKETLVEKMGYAEFNKEMSRKSNYYNEYILQDDYINMLRANKESKEQ